MVAQGWFTDAPPGVLYGTIFFAYLPVMWVHIGTLKLWLSVPLLSSRAASERAIFFCFLRVPKGTLMSYGMTSVGHFMVPFFV